MSHQRLTRRTFVTASGTAAVAALAGCANSGPGGDDNESDGETNDTDDGTDTDDAYTLTVTVEGDDDPIEGATVALERAGPGEMDGGDGGTGNESDNETDDAMGNVSDNETDAGGVENESDNETEDGGTGNETTTDGEGAAFPMEDETDGDGEVEFEDLEDGEYTVSAENEGEETEDDVKIDGGDADVTLAFGDADTGDDGTGNETESGDENATESDGA